jgi:serine/threonine protein kinase
MHAFEFLFPLLILWTVQISGDNGKPVVYSYTAVCTAFFDESGLQVGYEEHGKRGVIGRVPNNFPEISETVQTDSEMYIIEEVLGKGTGSAVYRATSQGVADNDVAIKFQAYADDEQMNSVATDFEVLNRTGIFGNLFPRAFYLSDVGSIVTPEGVQNLRYLVMELLGSSVWSFLRSNGYKLPMKTIASIGIQAVGILEDLHSLGIVHGDIHHENMIFARGNRDYDGLILSDRIKLGDYGKSSLYVNPTNHEHIEDIPRQIKEGRNMLFLSPYELALGAPSRREDIFRLMETLARMVDERGYSSVFKPFQQNREALLNAKRTFPLVEIFPGVHPVFADLFEYSRSLGFEQVPDYSGMKQKFTSILKDNGINNVNKIVIDV